MEFAIFEIQQIIEIRLSLSIKVVSTNMKYGSWSVLQLLVLLPLGVWTQIWFYHEYSMNLENVYLSGTHIINEAEKIRGVPKGVRYGSISVLHIVISPAWSVSALEADTRIIKLAILHMQNNVFFTKYVINNQTNMFQNIEEFNKI